MADYDLTGSLRKDFTFSINGEEFVFRKPTVREMRALSKKFAAINKETEDDLKIERSDEAMAELFTYVENKTSDRFIGDVLDEQPVDVQIAFNDMIQEQLTKVR